MGGYQEQGTHEEDSHKIRQCRGRRTKAPKGRRLVEMAGCCVLRLGVQARKAGLRSLGVHQADARVLLYEGCKNSLRVSEHLLTFCSPDIGSRVFQMWVHLTVSQRFTKVRSKKKSLGSKRFLYPTGPGAVSWYLLCISLGLDNLQCIACLRMPLLGCWGSRCLKSPGSRRGFGELGKGSAVAVFVYLLCDSFPFHTCSPPSFSVFY